MGARTKSGLPGIYNSTPLTIADGDGVALATDSTGTLLVAPAAGASFGSSTADGATFSQGTTTGGLSMGVYVASPQTITTGKAAAVAIDVNRNLRVVEQYAPVYEDNTVGVARVEMRFSFRNITTATTTTVKSGAGLFHNIVINKGVATATITIYDNTAASGTLIGTITFGAALLSDPPDLAIYNASFATGLTLVTSGATDITVMYR